MLESNMKNIFFSFHSQPAFKDKQHNKRKEVSFRPWFSNTSATPGSPAGRLLHKLSLQGKEAAVAKSLGCSQRPLIRKHTGVKIEAGASIISGQVQPEICTCNGEISEVTPKEEDAGASSAHLGQESEKRHIITSKGLDEERKATEEDRSLGGVTSLVADYSDSDSDTQ